MTEAPMDWKRGGCHCGAVTFEEEGAVRVTRIGVFDGKHWKEVVAALQSQDQA